MVRGFFHEQIVLLPPYCVVEITKKQRAFRVDIYLRGFVTKMTSNIDVVYALKHVGSLIKLLRSYTSQTFLIVSDFE